ncbi:unnamed protein product [Caenorhabditis nigoni]
MGKFFVFFLFWTSCLIQVETLLKFRISGQVICDYYENPNFHMKLKDRDIRIGLAEYHGSGYFSIFGEDTNMGKGNHYNPYMQIVHACNLYNTIMLFKYPMGDMFIPQGEVKTLNYVINITHAGSEAPIAPDRKLSKSADFSKFNDEESDRDIPLK